jgi:hypothetical protein
MITAGQVRSFADLAQWAVCATSTVEVGRHRAITETQPIADGPGLVRDEHPWDGPTLAADERHDRDAVNR